jgi:hypothetical protein
MSRWLASGNGEMNLPWNFVPRTGMETRTVWAGAPNVIVVYDGRDGSDAERGSWFSNFKIGSDVSGAPSSPARLLQYQPTASVATSKVRYTKCTLSILMTENREFRSELKIRGIPKELKQLDMTFFYRDFSSVLKDVLVTYRVTFEQ